MDAMLLRDNDVPFVRPFGNEVDVRQTTDGGAVSVPQDRGAWEVRWRDGSGTRRAKRVPSEEAAHAFDQALREVSPAARRSDTARGGSGVYP